MPTPTKFHPVYDKLGKRITVPIPETPWVSKRVSYPFHILIAKGDEFYIKDIAIENTLRSQVSKRNSLAQVGKKKNPRYTVSRCIQGLAVIRTQ